MSKIRIIVFCIISAATVTWATDVGGGISVFVPLSLLESGEGSVTLEQSLETSLGLGDFFSIPIGFVYNRVDGFQVSADGLGETDAPWFYGDCFMPYVMLKGHIPAGIFYVDLFGGAAANWSFVLNARYDKIEESLDGVTHVDNVEYNRVWGYGYLAGAAAGVKIDKISIDLGVTYRDIRHDLDLSFDADSNPVTYSDAKLLLRGISIALKGSFSL